MVHVCATTYLPNVVFVGACGPALSELVVSTENLQLFGMREGVLGEYLVRVRVRAYAARELRSSGMPRTSWLGRMHLHAMHRTNTQLVGSGCTNVHTVGNVRSTLYDATRADHAPAINYKSMQLI